MPELGPYGFVRGARGNSRPYRDQRAALRLNGSAAIDPLADMRGSEFLQRKLTFGPYLCFGAER
jgi:hypothetical protein